MLPILQGNSDFYNKHATHTYHSSALFMSFSITSHFWI